MLQRLYQRFRFEVLRRINPYRRRQPYRWARVREGSRLRVIVQGETGKERELRLRADSSDFTGFLQVFDPCQYDSRGLVRHADMQARYQAIVDAGRRPLIIDAGANIGMARSISATSIPRPRSCASSRRPPTSPS